MKVKEPGRPKSEKLSFCTAAGEACKAIFCPSLGFAINRRNLSYF